MRAKAGAGSPRRIAALIGKLAAATVLLTSVAAMFLPHRDFLPVSLVAIVLYVATSFPGLGRMARLFAVAAVVLGLVLGARTELSAAVATASFLISLFLALSMVSEVAARSPDTARIAQSILELPTRRIYLPLSVASHLLAIILNVGGIAVLMALVGIRSRLLAERGQLRTVSLAVMRGFAAMPMWAPFSVSVAITLSIFRDVHFFDLLPYGAAMAALHMLAGWALDGRAVGRGPPRADPDLEVLPMLWLALRIVAMAAGAFACEWLFDVRFIEGVLLSALVTAAAWALSQRWPGRTTNSTTPADPASRGHDNETIIIGAAGFIGSLLSSSLVAASGGLEPLSFAATGLVVAMVPLIMLGLGYVGLNPIICGSILGGLLLPLVPPGDHALAAVALLAGWGVTTSGSPFTGNVLLGSRLIGRSSFELAARWNGAFCIANAILFGVVLGCLHGLGWGP